MSTTRNKCRAGAIELVHLGENSLYTLSNFEGSEDYDQEQLAHLTRQAVEWWVEKGRWTGVLGPKSPQIENQFSPEGSVLWDKVSESDLSAPFA